MPPSSSSPTFGDWAVYNSAGDIVQLFCGTEPEVQALQVAIGAAGYVAGRVDPATTFVRNGQPATRQPAGQPPSRAARWSPARGEWLDPRSQAQQNADDLADRQDQIERLERQSLRAIREILLALPNLPPSVAAARQVLVDAEDAIQRLRRPRTPGGDPILRA